MDLKNRLSEDVVGVRYFPSEGRYRISGIDIDSVVGGILTSLDSGEVLRLPDGNCMLPINPEDVYGLQDGYSFSTITLDGTSVDCMEDLYTRMVIWSPHNDSRGKVAAETIRYKAEVRRNPVMRGFEYDLCVSSIRSRIFSE